MYNIKSHFYYINIFNYMISLRYFSIPLKKHPDQGKQKRKHWIGLIIPEHIESTMIEQAQGDMDC